MMVSSVASSKEWEKWIHLLRKHYVSKFIQSQQKLCTFKKTFILQQNFIIGIFNIVGKKGLAYSLSHLFLILF